MFRFAHPERERAPMPRGAIQPPRFDGYPYLISRIGKSALRHIALLPADWPRERIVAVSRAQAEANRFETAACFGPDDAEYAAFDNARTWPGPTPTGIYVIERIHLADRRRRISASSFRKRTPCGKRIAQRPVTGSRLRRMCWKNA